MFSHDNETTFTEDVLVGRSAFCLMVPDSPTEDLVVHREGDEDFVFLFESLDDAFDCAAQAAQVLPFWPKVGRAALSGLNFKVARFKPVGGGHVDILLPRRP
jgi:hypothetical protein